jgi:hypothetical protein
MAFNSKKFWILIRRIIMIKIDFEMSDADNIYVYKDALYLEDDNIFTEEEIQKMKQDRFNNWLSIILNPEPTLIENEPVDVLTYNTGI